jgi:hypothetical protein
MVHAVFVNRKSCAPNATGPSAHLRKNALLMGRESRRRRRCRRRRRGRRRRGRRGRRRRGRRGRRVPAAAHARTLPPPPGFGPAMLRLGRRKGCARVCCLRRPLTGTTSLRRSRRCAGAGAGGEAGAGAGRGGGGGRQGAGKGVVQDGHGRGELEAEEIRPVEQQRARALRPVEVLEQPREKPRNSALPPPSAHTRAHTEPVQGRGRLAAYVRASERRGPRCLFRGPRCFFPCR